MAGVPGTEGCLRPTTKGQNSGLSAGADRVVVCASSLSLRAVLGVWKIRSSCRPVHCPHAVAPLSLWKPLPG